MTGRQRALLHLKTVDPTFWEATKAWHKEVPQELTSKRTRNELFAALVSIVISQQLGVKAADSIWLRVKAACGARVTPGSVRRVREAKLRASGLSGAKIKAIKGIAAAIEGNTLDLMALKRAQGDEAHAVLTALWGLGPWSVEMFLMFAMGHADIFSPGDLGLVRGVERVYGLPREKVTHTSLLAISEKWAPYRTYACLLLWRSRDSAPPQLAKGRHRAT